ncbi:hypothetical protein CYMTET_39275 [Cymbomonas tetramitiformis]|uniref:Uncharacterized protein n=1 Tax=Cymbomonas tetramitiformis TaxID=36881 RepID=A0AAE0CBT4_9CHLO|nr:hypothetical protein CYMTET_39275 [Cymbomonas tetramitiformis]
MALELGCFTAAAVYRTDVKRVHLLRRMRVPLTCSSHTAASSSSRKAAPGPLFSTVYNEKWLRQSGTSGVRRRDFLLGGLLAPALQVNPAHAGESREQKYFVETNRVIDEVLVLVDMKVGDRGIPNQIKAVKLDTNQWVGKYRKDRKFSERVSYQQLFVALNALGSHYSQAGEDAPLPDKKRKRIIKYAKEAKLALYDEPRGMTSQTQISDVVSTAKALLGRE